MTRTSAFLLLLGLMACKDDTEPVDSDVQQAEDADGDGHAADVDCDDDDAAVFPGAEERCDGVDNDCNGLVDDEAADAPNWYGDQDGDGYGDLSASQRACEAPAEHVADSSDCDDGDGDVFPGAEELCNGVDDDCDGEVDDDPADPSAWYADEDGDGYGDPDASEQACDAPSGFVADGSDCDDSDSSAYPGGAELCDGVDNDCNGQVDDDASDALTWYADADRDGYGDPSFSVAACDAPSGYVSDDSDCDDGDASSSPGGSEVCDSVDNDCNGQIDDDAADAMTWYADSDADGYGDPSAAVDACDAPSGYVSDDSDCDDGDASVSPDGSEVCDSVDNDCNGSVDDNASDALTWFADSDADGYGDPSAAVDACDAPSGYVSDDTDCDDSDGAVYPWAGDTNDDGVDGDCDGLDCMSGDYNGAYFTICPWTYIEVAAAEADCVSAGYDGLASIRDQGEQDFLFALLQANGLVNTTAPYIAFSKASGSWAWTDGATETYTNWHPGEPNGGGVPHTCAHMNWALGYGGWNDLGCTGYSASWNGAVCQIR